MRPLVAPLPLHRTLARISLASTAWTQPPPRLRPGRGRSRRRTGTSCSSARSPTRPPPWPKAPSSTLHQADCTSSVYSLSLALGALGDSGTALGGPGPNGARSVGLRAADGPAGAALQAIPDRVGLLEEGTVLSRGQGGVPSTADSATPSASGDRRPSRPRDDRGTHDGAAGSPPSSALCNCSTQH